MDCGSEGLGLVSDTEEDQELEERPRVPGTFGRLNAITCVAGSFSDLPRLNSGLESHADKTRTSPEPSKHQRSEASHDDR
jgi:hypothetical protein